MPKRKISLSRPTYHERRGSPQPIPSPDGNPNGFIASANRGRPRAVLNGWSIGLLLGVLLAASACATPVGVTRVSMESMSERLSSNVLSTGQPSQYSEQLLTRLGLRARFDDEPEAVLAGLRGPGTRLSREYLFALSELSFFHAVTTQKAEYYLASTVYALAFLVESRTKVDDDPLDPRLRLAANLYNVGLAQGLLAPDGESVEIRSGSRPLPFGTLEISVKQPVKVYKGMPVGQLIYFPVEGEIMVKYNQKKNAKYNSQPDKPIESMMWKNNF